MKKTVVALLLVLLCTPTLASAVDTLGCDVWLESGNVLMWAACRVTGWVAFNMQLEEDLREAGLYNP